MQYLRVFHGQSLVESHFSIKKAEVEEYRSSMGYDNTQDQQNFTEKICNPNPTEAPLSNNTGICIEMTNSNRTHSA